MSKALITAITRLLETKRLPASALTQAQQHSLQTLQNRMGAVQIKKQGRGVVYCIKSETILRQLLQELSPNTKTQQPDNLPERARNIGHSRNSKSAKHTHQNSYLLLKSVGQVYWHNANSTELPLADICAQTGAALLQLNHVNSKYWATKQAFWLVENQALFDQTDWLPEYNISLAYYQGQLKNQLIDWLSLKPRASHIYFFPDYDGVGIHNYLRLKNKLGTNISLWLMPNWQAKLTKYGNNNLWQKTQKDFFACTQKYKKLIAEDAQLQALLKSMQTQALALEQEAIWNG